MELDGAPDSAREPDATDTLGAVLPRPDWPQTRGRRASAIYTKGLTVAPGATLVTNGVKIYTFNANVVGTGDDPTNICEVTELPRADINRDGIVSGEDLALILSNRTP